jgi:hypothetical protein
VRGTTTCLEASSQPELAAAGPKDAGARRGATGRGRAARSAAGGVCGCGEAVAALKAMRGQG